jgi:hypothetical protein
MSANNNWPTLRQMVGMTDEELASVDPVVMNLVVAKGIPSLSTIDVSKYVRLANDWATDLRRQIPNLEREFRTAPEKWRNDLGFFRLGLVCWYIDLALGIAYREDQRNVKDILYTDPSDLFLNGVMDSRRGTCGNMAALNVVLGRRIGLPVSLACLNSHFFCRYDDGLVTHNIEGTQTGKGGFCSDSDEELLSRHQIPAKAQSCGSDLRAVTAREMLGLFVGLRARHLENTNRMSEAEPDYLLARYLFPHNRYLYISQNQISVQCSMHLFEPHEKGHPIEVCEWMQDVVRVAPWRLKSEQNTNKKESLNGSDVDAYFGSIAWA